MTENIGILKEDIIYTNVKDKTSWISEITILKNKLCAKMD